VLAEKSGSTKRDRPGTMYATIADEFCPD